MVKFEWVKRGISRLNTPRQFYPVMGENTNKFAVGCAPVMCAPDNRYVSQEDSAHPTKIFLLHRHTLRQILRLVHVKSQK